MTARELRALGCRVIFRGGRVIVDVGNAREQPDTECAIISASINRGGWVRLPLELWSGATDAECAQVAAVEDACYCDSCSTGCDYCTGVRVVPS